MISRNLTGTGLPPLAAQAIAGAVNDGLTATGTTQATALLISGDLNVFSTVASGAGCILPVGGENDTYSIINDGANTLLIYPPIGGTINGGAVNASASLAAGSAIQINFQSSLASRVIGNVLSLASSLGSALIGFLQAGSGAVTITAQSKMRETVNPIDFGAVGDGTTDDTAEMLLALSTGKVVDGAGRTYGITGLFQFPANFIGLINATLKQLTPAATNCRTIYIDNVDGFKLMDVKVDRNGNAGGGTLNDFAGIWISNSANFDLDRVKVTGGGAGNGIVIASSNNFRVKSPEIYSIVYDVAVLPPDDVINGIFFTACSHFTVIAPYIHDCGGLVASVATKQKSRGLTFGACKYFDVYGLQIENVDQGCDVTGGNYNHDFNFYGGTIKGCYTFSWKAANSAYRGNYYGCIGDGAGLMNFIASGQTDALDAVPGDLHYQDCISYNAGKDGGYAGNAARAGFRVQSAVTIDISYPRGVIYTNCLAIDDQGTPTMQNGFVCDVVVAASTQDYNELFGCKSVGHAVASDTGFNSPDVSLILSANQSLANNAYTAVNWASEVYDTGVMHSTVSNNSIVFINQRGYYRVTITIMFASNAVGNRSVKIQKNGVDVVGGEAALPANASVSTPVTISKEIELLRGQNVSGFAFQNSGGALNMLATGCSFDVSLIKRLP